MTKPTLKSAPMQMQSNLRSNTFPIAGMRLLDGDDEAAKAAAAAEAARVAAEAEAAAEAARIAALAKPSDEVAKLLKEQMATKARLKDATDAAAAAAAKLKDFEGIDPVKVRELLKAQNDAEAAKKAAEEENLKKAGEFDRLKEMMAEEHKKEKETLSTGLTETKTQLDLALAQINDLTIGSNFHTSSYIGSELVLTPTIARQVYGAHFENENGNVVAYDKPRGSKDRTQLVDGSGQPLGFEAAIKKIVESSPDKDRLLRSKLKDGTGSHTVDVTVGNRQQQNQNNADGPTGLARIQASLEKGGLTKKK